MKNRFLGIVLAIVGALLGTIPWLIIGYYGWIASIAGFVIGFGAFKGYEIGYGKVDSFGKYLVVILILIIVPLAQYLNMIIVSIAEGVDYSYAMTYGPEFFISNFGSFLPDILIGYLLAGLGNYQFFTEGKKIRFKI